MTTVLQNESGIETTWDVLNTVLTILKKLPFSAAAITAVWGATYRSCGIRIFVCPIFVIKSINGIYAKSSEFTNFNLSRGSSNINPTTILIEMTIVDITVWNPIVTVIGNPNSKLFTTCDTISAVSVITGTEKRISGIGTRCIVSTTVCS